LWQVHLAQTPLLLRRLLYEEFDMAQDWIIGLIMGIDNLLAIILLPLFGILSDRTKNRLGKRMTFIVVGGILSVIFFPLMAVMFVVGRIWLFIAMLALMKIAMNLWRGPAVSLMPDITPKPLRPKANAIVNFVGYIGAIFGGGLVFLWSFYWQDPMSEISLMPFYVTAGVMLAAIMVLLIFFKENKVNEEMKEQMEIGENLSETQERVVADKPLSKADKKNLWIVMATVFMSWFAFNAIQTFGSTFEQLYFGTTNWGLLIIVLPVVSLAAFLPLIKLTKKMGRKNSVLLGIGINMFAVVLAMFMPNSWALIPVFVLSGIGWALVNISAFPIVVEMASLKNIGKITGIYYIATQSAQFLTSVLAGVFFGAVGYTRFSFWGYAFVFMVLALVLCFIFKPRKVELETATESPEEIQAQH